MTKSAQLADIRDRATITVEEAAAVLGIGRGAAYTAAHSGELPTLRIGRRLLVPVQPLLQLVGAAETPSGAQDERPLHAV